MYRRTLPTICVLALLLLVAPARAAELISPDQLPVQGLVTGERSREAFLINGRIAGVVQGEFIYSDDPAKAASHAVWHEYNAAGGLTSVIEYIAIGDTLYERRDSGQRWKMGRVGDANVPLPRDVELFFSQLPPADFPADFTHVSIGDTEVDGVPAGHYQAFLNTNKRPATVPEVKVDTFHARQAVNGIENYFIKSVITMTAVNPAGTTDVLQYVRVWSEPNLPRVIGAPPAELVDPFTARAGTDMSSGARSLTSWLRSHTARSIPR